MIAGGRLNHAGLASNETKLVEVSISGNSARICQPPPELPVGVVGAVSDLKTSQGEPLLCGGLLRAPIASYGVEPDLSDRCYKLDRTTGQWEVFSDVSPRGVAVRLSNGTYWILWPGQEPASYLYDGGDTFTPGRVLDGNGCCVCAVQISDTETFTISAEARIYDHATGDWAFVETAPRLGFNGLLGCALLKDQAGTPTHLVVVGGGHNIHRTKVTRLMDLGTRQWAPGPDMPQPASSFYRSAVVQVGRSLIVAGGTLPSHPLQPSRVGYRLDPDLLEWVEVPEAGYFAHAPFAVALDPEVFGCH